MFVFVIVSAIIKSSVITPSFRCLYAKPLLGRNVGYNLCGCQMSN